MPNVSVRRKDRQTSEQEALRLIAEAEVGHLGTTTEDGYPYVIALNHALIGNKIYLHSAPEGHKIDNIKRDPRVCYEVASMLGIQPGDIPCATKTQFESAVVFGKAKIIEDPEAKRAALSVLAQKYVKMAGPFGDAHLQKICVIEIEIEAITGKRLS